MTHGDTGPRRPKAPQEGPAEPAEKAVDPPTKGIRLVLGM